MVQRVRENARPVNGTIQQNLNIIRGRERRTRARTSHRVAKLVLVVVPRPSSSKERRSSQRSMISEPVHPGMSRTRDEERGRERVMVSPNSSSSVVLVPRPRRNGRAVKGARFPSLCIRACRGRRTKNEDENESWSRKTRPRRRPRPSSSKERRSSQRTTISEPVNPGSRGRRTKNEDEDESWSRATRPRPSSSSLVLEGTAEQSKEHDFRARESGHVEDEGRRTRTRTSHRVAQLVLVRRRLAWPGRCLKPSMICNTGRDDLRCADAHTILDGQPLA